MTKLTERQIIALKNKVKYMPSWQCKQSNFYVSLLNQFNRKGELSIKQIACIDRMIEKEEREERIQDALDRGDEDEAEELEWDFETIQKRTLIQKLNKIYPNRQKDELYERSQRERKDFSQSKSEWEEENDMGDID